MDRNEKRNTFKNVQNKRNTKNTVRGARAGMIVALVAAGFFAVCAFTFGLKYLEERDEADLLRAELSFYQKQEEAERDQTEPESELTAAESELTAAESETVSGDGQNGQATLTVDGQAVPENGTIPGDGQNGQTALTVDGQAVPENGQDIQTVRESETMTEESETPEEKISIMNQGGEESDFIDGLGLHTQPRSN